MQALREIELPGIKKLRSGKVREVFDLGDTLLFVVSDRLSAFDVGHDLNIDLDQAGRMVGAELTELARDLSLELYQAGSEYAAARGIIIADTKFEFGKLGDELLLIDECLTPDSSRFWPADEYRVGISPPSFDKQFVRDYLETLDWNKTPPAPHLPREIIEKTSAKYREAFSRLTGGKLE